jgi:cell wall-associated NlpC family hydrolase
MPPRLSRPLLAFALAASTLACAAAAPLVSQAAPAAVAPAIPAAPLERLDPGPRPYPPTRAEPKPTLGDRAAAIALRAIGTPYRWGGSSPASGFDCSGLVYWAYGRLGMELPHSSYALHDLGHSVARSQLEAGDLLFFEGLGHVGLYVGRDRMVHAPQSGRHVEVVSLGESNYGSRFVAARRLEPENPTK